MSENITAWLNDKINGSGGLRDYQNREGEVSEYPDDLRVAVWITRCLGNPKCEGSQEVIDAILANRGTPATAPGRAPDLVNWEQLLGDVHKAIGGLPLDKADALCDALRPHFATAEQQAVRALGPAPGPHGDPDEPFDIAVGIAYDRWLKSWTGNTTYFDLFKAGAEWARSPAVEAVLDAARVISKYYREFERGEYTEIHMSWLKDASDAVLAWERAEGKGAGDAK